MKEGTIENICFALLLIIFLLILILMGIRGINKSIQNQDIMLCESAKVSGNREYLEKCECFYEGEDIKCLQTIN